jgi:hypothetical protein
MWMSFRGTDDRLDRGEVRVGVLAGAPAGRTWLSDGLSVIQRWGCWFRRVVQPKIEDHCVPHSRGGGSPGCDVEALDTVRQCPRIRWCCSANQVITRGQSGQLSITCCNRLLRPHARAHSQINPTISCVMDLGLSVRLADSTRTGIHRDRPSAHEGTKRTVDLPC